MNFRGIVQQQQQRIYREQREEQSQCRYQQPAATHTQSCWNNSVSTVTDPRGVARVTVSLLLGTVRAVASRLASRVASHEAPS